MKNERTRDKIVCAECCKLFVAKRRIGRRPRFCSRKCYEKQYYRHPADTRDTPKNAFCQICEKAFVKTKRHQRYCSIDCYKKAWIVNNREKHNARVRKRRIEKPEWYREHDPVYNSRYRSKILSSRPWHYLLISRKNESKQKGWIFNLTDEWAAARWTGYCEITKIKFRSSGKQGPHPFSPSIDKIDPTKGYTQENSRFILLGCNALKGRGSDQDMLEIAKAIVNNAHKDLQHVLFEHTEICVSTSCQKDPNNIDQHSYFASPNKPNALQNMVQHHPTEQE